MSVALADGTVCPDCYEGEVGAGQIFLACEKHGGPRNDTATHVHLDEMHRDIAKMEATQNHIETAVHDEVPE